jgi:ferric-dicitrate binding protein FerR (iron transport regulator)
MKLSELELLISKYQSGHASEEEKAIIDNWLQHNPDDRLADPRKRLELITAIWGNIHASINQPAAAESPAVVRSIGWLQRKYIFRVAASLLFAALTGIGFYYFANRSTPVLPQYATVTASDAAAMEHMLPDGTKVWLFPGSAIQVPENYNGTERHVMVKGRAFFDVKQDILKPFFVNAGDMQTRVIGTSFEVNTLLLQNPSVVVKSGRVAVSWRGKEQVQLSLNKRIVFNISTGSTQASVDSVNADALCSWWSGAFNFEQTPLTDVLQNIGQWYKTGIGLQGDKWKKEKLTIQIETDLTIGEAMRLLCETIGAKYKMKGQEIIIY